MADERWFGGQGGETSILREGFWVCWGSFLMAGFVFVALEAIERMT